MAHFDFSVNSFLLTKKQPDSAVVGPKKDPIFAECALFRLFNEISARQEALRLPLGVQLSPS